MKDDWFNRIVGYSIADRLTPQLEVDALEMAMTRRGRATVAGCVVHSDRVSQLRSRPYLRALDLHGLAERMGRVACSAANAAMEFLFTLLQKKVLSARHWHTRDQLPLAIVTWIKGTYHRRRRQSPRQLTSIESETINGSAHAARPPQRVSQPNRQRSR